MISLVISLQVMTANRHSSFVRLLPCGTVLLHYRLRSVLLCDMRLKRFPHDTQNCTMRLESCQYIVSILQAWLNKASNWQIVAHL